MPPIEIEIAAPPEVVWAVLAKAHRYAAWLSAEVRDADETWPSPGSRLHHTTGIGPLVPTAAGMQVTMDEGPVAGLVRVVPGTGLVADERNAFSLRRLKEFAEGPTGHL